MSGFDHLKEAAEHVKDKPYVSLFVDPLGVRVDVRFVPRPGSKLLSANHIVEWDEINSARFNPILSAVDQLVRGYHPTEGDLL